jgi:hypothetical protein
MRRKPDLASHMPFPDQAIVRQVDYTSNCQAQANNCILWNLSGRRVNLFDLLRIPMRTNFSMSSYSKRQAGVNDLEALFPWSGGADSSASSTRTLDTQTLTSHLTPR